MGAPSFKVVPLDPHQTIGHALQQAVDDCTGAEPSLSLLFIRAEQGAEVLKELYAALTELKRSYWEHVRRDWNLDDFLRFYAVEQAMAALAKARGEA